MKHDDNEKLREVRQRVAKIHDDIAAEITRLDESRTINLFLNSLEKSTKDLHDFLVDSYGDME